MPLDLFYPSFEAVVAAHSKIIMMTSGESGMVSSSNLKYILETVQDVGKGHEDEKEVIKRKAAYLMYNIIVLHPFVDGNKRSAFEVTKRFLELNGWIFNPRQEEAFDNLVTISAGNLDQRSAEEWIGKNLRKGRV